MRPPASSTAAATASGRASVKYKYQTIKEAYDLVMSSDVQQKVVNLYCVVMECSNIRNTRGTDKVCNLKVADSSTSEMGYSEGVELVCFAPSADLMPTVERPGDIIRMHRVRIGEWNGSPQLVGKLASTKWQPFHYVLFHGKVGPGTFVAESEAFVPYKSSSANFTFCPVEDKRQVGMLRGDVAPEALQAATTAVASGANDFTRRIDQLHSLNDEGKRNVDILCKVLTITDRGAMDSLFFGVWDGTVAMAESIADCDDTGAISDAHPEVNDLLGQSYVSDMWFSEEYLKQITDENFGADPKRGTILPVVVPHSLRDSVKAINPKEKPWVTFRNVRVTFHMGQYYALYTRISRWAVHAAPEEEAAPSGEAETLAALRVAASPTTTTHPNAPITPLRQLLCSKGDAKPNYYRVLARMIGYAPTEDEWQEGKNINKINKIMLRDDTGDIAVQIKSQDFASIFPVGNSDDTGDLVDRVAELCGFTDTDDTIVWLDLCVLKYYSPKLGGQEKPWEAGKFMLFDTKWCGFGLAKAADDDQKQ